jgi:uncharacterized protein HemY
VSLGYKLGAPGPAVISADGKKFVSSGSPTDLQIESLNLPAAIALWQSRVPEEWSENPELYRRLGRRVLKLGEPLLAYDVLTEALKEAPHDVEVRQQLALALARSGATQRANAILTQLRDEGHRDEETLGILARTHKDSGCARRQSLKQTGN